MEFQEVIINDCGKETKAIWLGEFYTEVKTFIYTKKFWFKRTKMEIKNEIKKYYIVFVPYTNKLKEMKLLSEDLIIDKNIDISKDNKIVNVPKFTSLGDEDEYINSMEIRDFVGYDFIYKNNSILSYISCYNNDWYCLDILYKNMPSLAVLRLEYKPKDNLILKDIIQAKNTANIEIAYNKESSNKKIFKNYKIKNYDSLYIKEEDFDCFFKNYLPLLDKCISPDKSNKFCYYGLNYYTKERSKEIFDIIKSSDLVDRRSFLIWLYQAFNLYNGFYIYGI